jgi:hypothetical protein
MRIKSIRMLGGIIFFFGIFLGLVMSLAVVWSAFEGISYFYTGAGYPSFNGLNCPRFITRSETGIVNAIFDNPGSQEIQPYYEVAISGQTSTRTLEGQLPVPAHASKSVRWTVDARDIDLGFFVFIDMNVLPVAGYSTREDTCGIMVLNLSGPTGGQVFNLTLALSLLSIFIGLGLWENSVGTNGNGSLNLRRAMKALGIMVLLAMLTSFMGGWLAGLLFCVLTILLVFIILRLFIER